MDIAQSKRSENIAEYILYLWQIEDLLRALEFDEQAIDRVLVAPRGFSESKAMLFRSWYVEMGNLLRREGKAESGHLDHTLHLIADIQDLARRLTKLEIGKEYRRAMEALEPLLPELKSKMAGKEIGDVELCFRALYASILYRMKGEHSELTDQVVKVISPVIAELARVYKGVEEGTIELKDE
ncbi:MAG: DUF4924 family protein [Rikenellaceae bacterium]|nr:DUF4924 family protein [Rikenellaceae bacterium]